MGAERTDYKPSRRDELISLARYGKITPAEAEAIAAAEGLPPFEQQPELPAFDPMIEPRWSIVMAVSRSFGRIARASDHRVDIGYSVSGMN
jgi:hypothetical protein